MMANLNAGLVACGFSGNPDQYCYGILYFCAFSGGGAADPLSPLSGSAHASYACIGMVAKNKH